MRCQVSAYRKKAAKSLFLGPALEICIACALKSDIRPGIRRSIRDLFGRRVRCGGGGSLRFEGFRGLGYFRRLGYGGLGNKQSHQVRILTTGSVAVIVRKSNRPASRVRQALTGLQAKL